MASRTKRVTLAITAISLLLLCAIAAGVLWATGPALRCGLPAKGQAQPGWAARRVASGGIERCYYLYTPSGYDPDQPLPVVVSLHGFLSNPASQALISRWHQLADQEGFFVLYPQGTQYPQRWNATETWGSSVDDIQFLQDILDDLPTLASVDRERVYVNGFSNGGGMTVRAGCELADRIAAVGTVAAAVASLDDCEPARPVAHIAFQGTLDPLVPYDGGDHRGPLVPTGAKMTHAPKGFIGFEDWTRAWAKVNGCDPLPQTSPRQGDVRDMHYVGCKDGAEVITYIIGKGGHTWPGGRPIPGLGKTSTDIDATEEMWRFFQAHSLTDQP